MFNSYDNLTVFNYFLNKKLLPILMLIKRSERRFSVTDRKVFFLLCLCKT